MNTVPEGWLRNPCVVSTVHALGGNPTLVFGNSSGDCFMTQYAMIEPEPAAATEKPAACAHHALQKANPPEGVLR